MTQFGSGPQHVAENAQLFYVRVVVLNEIEMVVNTARCCVNFSCHCASWSTNWTAMSAITQIVSGDVGDEHTHPPPT
jgi:hypothetical protein